MFGGNVAHNLQFGSQPELDGISIQFTDKSIREHLPNRRPISLSTSVPERTDSGISLMMERRREERTLQHGTNQHADYSGTDGLLH